MRRPSAVIARCVYCGSTEDEPHSRRCSVSKWGETARYEVPRQDLETEVERLRKELDHARHYLRIAATWMLDQDRRIKLTRAADRATDALDPAEEKDDKS